MFVAFGVCASSNVATAQTNESLVPLIQAFDNFDFQGIFVKTEQMPVVSDLAITRDKTTMYVGCDDQRVYRCNLKTKEIKQAFQRADDWVRAVAVSPTSNEVAVLSQKGRLSVWDSQTESRLREIDAGVVGARALAYSPNGKVIAVGSFNATVNMFDASTLQKLAGWSAPGESSTAISFSPDGSLLALGGRDGIVRVWTTFNGKKLYDLPLTNVDGGKSRRVRAVAFSPDGTRIAAGGDADQIVLWELSSGKQVGSLYLSEGKVFSLVFCGVDRLVSGDSCNLVRFWDATNQSQIARSMLPADRNEFRLGHKGTVSVLKYVEDGTSGYILSGSFDTTVKMWKLP